MKISLGVVDMVYDYGDNPGETTHEVAVELEENYGVFTHFWDLHKDTIIAEAGETIALSFINHIKYGAPLVGDAPMGETIEAFNHFLEQEEMAGLNIDGVPTKAALDGKNSRLKQESGARRPSFIDGGLFKTSFIAWINNDAES
ncbi:hypothetical protein [Citrobacter werkmanii]|uniref:hypothetical protein n=1 Tax=Citrobacter werkmanii TaxID=67827 RepID=UPI00300C9D31